MNMKMQPETIVLPEITLTAAGWVPYRAGKPAGWGCLLTCGKHRRTLRGCADTKSERRAEILGIVAGLQQLKRPCLVHVFTGDSYVFECAQSIFSRRKSNTFVSAVSRWTAPNSDLWQRIQALMDTHSIKIHWVRARSRDDDTRAARSAARAAS
jgi:ribonuclease HI